MSDSLLPFHENRQLSQAGREDFILIAPLALRGNEGG